MHKYDVYDNELTELHQAPLSSRPIFQDIHSVDDDTETSRILGQATEEFSRIEKAAEAALANILHCTVWSDIGFEDFPRKMSLDQAEVEVIRKYLTFVRFRNGAGYRNTIESLREAAKEHPQEGSVYPAYRFFFVRIRKRFILRQFISFFTHTPASRAPTFSRSETSVHNIGAGLDTFREIMELYCWRLGNAEICLGIASEDQEYLLPDRLFGTLDEDFKEDPNCDFFLPIFPTLSVYVLAATNGGSPSKSTHTCPMDRTISIDIGIEYASDVHLRNALILQTYPHYLYFSSLRTVALSTSSYDEFRWTQEHQDYSRLRQRCRQKFMQETVTKTLVLRPSVVLADLTDQVRMVGNSAVAHGSFSDVWKGRWDDPVERRTRFVAVKFLRQIMVQNVREKLLKRLQLEVLAWHKLCHRNVSPLFGIIQSTNSIGMVSPWYDHGTICEYVKCNPRADKLQLLIQVASGIAYLHNFKPVIIHGDLKGCNILIDDHGFAIISDFGLSKVMEETKPDSKNGTSFFAGSTRWMAPELILALAQDDRCIPTLTTQSDVYAFASICLEVGTGQVPYADRSNDYSVTVAILRGVKPTRGLALEIHSMPLKCVETFWAMLDRCWNDHAPLRPSMVEMLAFLDSMVIS